MILGRRAFGAVLAGMPLTIPVILATPGTTIALEVGQPAPDFVLPSTMGGEVALSDFRSKKWVLLEFYSADFAPT
jgi:hypothetical protein